MGMLKLVDRSRLGRGEVFHISSSLITHNYAIFLIVIYVYIQYDMLYIAICY